jgi:hypothetical protein
VSNESQLQALRCGSRRGMAAVLPRAIFPLEADHEAGRGAPGTGVDGTNHQGRQLTGALRSTYATTVASSSDPLWKGGAGPMLVQPAMAASNCRRRICSGLRSGAVARLATVSRGEV